MSGSLWAELAAAGTPYECVCHIDGVDPCHIIAEHHAWCPVDIGRVSFLEGPAESDGLWFCNGKPATKHNRIFTEWKVPPLDIITS